MTSHTHADAAQVSRNVEMMAGKIADSKKFVPAVPTSECIPGRATSAVCGGLDICVATNTDGSIYALGNKAPVIGTVRVVHAARSAIATRPCWVHAC